MAASPIPWIIASILLVVIISVVYLKLRRWQEGFTADPTALATPPPADPSNTVQAAGAAAAATFCPPGSIYFLNKQGDSLCCEGAVENRRCKGRTVCTLSKGTGKVPSCTSVLQQLSATAASKLCPPSMPNYYVSPITGKRGCTESALTAAGDEPLYRDRPQCTIGTSPAADLLDEASCINKKRLEEMACISSNCSKTLHKYKEGFPLVLTQTYQVPDQVTAAPRMCTDEHSMEIYLDAAEPNWRSSGKPEYNFAISTEFCGTAKAVLIDKKYVEGAST